MVTALYELDRAGVAYPGRGPALHDVTLTIVKSEHLALLGANGAGKSTLLQLLAGLVAPATGTVKFEGMPLAPEILSTDAPFRRAFRSRVGLLFQNSDVQLFCPTVREEIAFGPLQVASREEALERTEGVMRQFSIELLAEEAPYALSGGEKRRVALASVLVMNPDVLLLDEPMANLDPRTSDLLLDILGQYIGDASKTLVTATHDLDVARMLSKSCAVLTPEHTVALHSPSELVLADLELLHQVNLISRRRLRSGWAQQG